MRNLLIALLISTAATGAAHAQITAIDERATAIPQISAGSDGTQVAQREGRRGGDGGQRGQRVQRQREGGMAGAGMGRRGGGEGGGGWRARQGVAQGQQAVPQEQRQVRGDWNRGDGNRGIARVEGVRGAGRVDGDRGGGRFEGRRNWDQSDIAARQARQARRNGVAVSPGGSIDRNNDGRIDRYYDRNRNGNLDRRFDRNNDERLDRRYDRNRDGQLDPRLDRNNNERLDRRFDRDRDGRFDNRQRNDSRWSYGGRGYDWNRGWRNDRRYDWYGYRNRYRNNFYAPRYYNPYGYGYGYSRFSIGIYLDSLFYSNRYWINDPWQYRLPSAAYGTRWVRYYNDVLLVDTDTGYVIDVIHDFFL